MKDLNKNNIYDGPPTDLPIANTTIFLVLGASSRRLGNRAQDSTLGETTTDSNGGFVIAFPPQTPGTGLAVVKDLVTRDPLIFFTATSSGGAPDALIPVPRPAQVRSLET
jgi:hypothetical protein